MNQLRALGHFMNYCNRNVGIDPYVTQERFDKGNRVILNSSEDRFYGCPDTGAVLREINWPDIR